MFRAISVYRLKLKKKKKNSCWDSYSAHSAQFSKMVADNNYNLNSQITSSFILATTVYTVWKRVSVQVFYINLAAYCPLVHIYGILFGT